MDKLGQIDIKTKLQSYDYSKVPQLPDVKKNSLSSEEKKQIEKAAREFESMFTYLIFKGMRKAMLSGLVENEESNDFGGDILNDLSLMEVSNQLSKFGLGTGIANIIYEELTGEKLMHLEVVAPKKITQRKQVKLVENRTAGNFSLQYNPNKFSSIVDRLSQYNSIIEDVANRHNLSASLLKSVIAVESAGNPTAVSRAGAKGLMQLIDSTAKYVGVKNIFDPKENIEGGAKYLREMLETFDGNLELALAAYNAGPGNVLKYNGIPPFKETQTYIAKVKRYLSLFQKVEEGL